MVLVYKYISGIQCHVESCLYIFGMMFGLSLGTAVWS